MLKWHSYCSGHMCGLQAGQSYFGDGCCYVFEWTWCVSLQDNNNNSNNIAYSSPIADIKATSSCLIMFLYPVQDYHFLSNNVAVRASGSSTARDAAAAQQELTQYMENLVMEKEKNPGKDLISEVIKTQLKEGKITREQLVAHAFLHLVAGEALYLALISLCCGCDCYLCCIFLCCILCLVVTQALLLSSRGISLCSIPGRL